MPAFVLIGKTPEKPVINQTIQGNDKDNQDSPEIFSNSITSPCLSTRYNKGSHVNRIQASSPLY